ncbi:protein RECOGNITION OF PERONOSPORA PARASITICA 7 isoform X2 [Aegilops tauschii subsp. strangulata]|nr:putative disease resistance protein RGA3 isoform X2 [Aegilops tauschii subsp. strangulata]
MVGTEMLAAAAVSQVARKIGEIIGAAQGEVTLCCSFSDDLESIKDTLVYLEDLLKNAERNSFGSERANLRHWLAQIKSLAFDIEDMVDDYYSSKEQFEGSSSYAQKGSLFCSLSNPVISKVSMVHKMKSKRELLQTRQHLPNQYHFISHINSVVDFDEKQTTSYRNSDITLFGRDRDLENLMNMIMQKSVGEISIISIVGPMGLGKTSLAQLVFNDARTKAFSFRIWVHVSMGNVSLEKIGRDIVSQTTERIEGNMQLQLIKNAVRTILNKYSCLIVLDSLWGKDEEVNELKQMLLTGIQTESKIVVTTHSYKVAELVSTVPPYKLSALSEDDCLNIFSQRAMAGRGDPLFREYGEEIVRRCGGTPLVANFLGSVVNAQRQRREIWKAAKDKEMWKIEEDYPEDKISPLFPSFKIIYYNMPHELRLCFVYCSIFPKGSVIDKKKLIQQWIALDMIESRHGTLPHDVTAEKYIDELKAIYFLQVIERHQLKQLRYLDASTLSITTLPPQFSSFNKLQALDLSETELMELPSFLSNLKGLNYLNLQGCQKLQELKSLDLLHDLHYLNLSCCPEVRSFPESIENLTKLRFLNLSRCSKLPTLPNRLLQSFASLCSLVDLNLSGFEFQMLPEFFGNICSLQYLNLSECSKLEELPQSFGQLAYLKALNLSSCPDLKILGSFECLTSLQFLNLSNCTSLEYLPLCLKKLQNLDVSGCQDGIVQSCSSSSGSSPTHQFSEQAEQVRLSIVTSEIIPEAPVIGDLKGKKKLASASGLDVVPEVVTKPNETGDTPLIPGRPFSLSSSHSSSFASSSRAPLAYVSSSDVSKNNNLVPNGEITGTQFNEKCQEPQDLIKDVLITEENICSLDTPVHVHELATVEGDDDGHVIKYNGVYQHSVLCDRPNQGVVVQQSN